MTDSMSINTSMNVTGTPVSNTISTPPTQVPAVQTKTDKTAAVSSEDATKQPATSTLVTTDGNAEKAVSVHGDTLEISSQGMDKAKEMITAPTTTKASGMPTASSTTTASGKPTASGTAPLSNASTAGSSSNSSAVNLVTTVTEADDTESTADLSKYSDADLKKLVADGKISSVQYNQEMDRRKEANNTKDQGSSETADNQNFINNLQ
jgi:hypothetical protein